METFSAIRSKSSSNTRSVKFTTIQENLSQLSKPTTSLRSCKLKVQQNLNSPFFDKLLKKRKNFNKSYSKNNDKISISKFAKTGFSEFFQKKSQENQEQLQNTIKSLQLEVNKLKKENFQLKEEVRSLTKDSKDSFIVAKVFNGCLENLIDIQEFWHIVNPNDLKLVTSLELKRAVRGLGIQMKDKKLDLFFDRLSQGCEGIREDEFLERMIQLKPSFVVTFNDLKDVLKTLKQALKGDISQLDDLFLKTFKRQKVCLKEAVEGFKRIFQDVCIDDLEILARGIFGFESLLSISELLKLLKKILDN